MASNREAGLAGLAGARTTAQLASVLALGLGVFAIHSRAYAGWVLDDAGISSAYAMNFARGLGLVAQAGAAPVEGYTDALWGVPPRRVRPRGRTRPPRHAEDPRGAFVVGTYVTLLLIVRRVAVRPVLVGGRCWSSALRIRRSSSGACRGSRTALYAFTVVLLAYLTLRALEADPVRRAPLVPLRSGRRARGDDPARRASSSPAPSRAHDRGGEELAAHAPRVRRGVRRPDGGCSFCRAS